MRCIFAAQYDGVLPTSCVRARILQRSRTDALRTGHSMSGYVFGGGGKRSAGAGLLMAEGAEMRVDGSEVGVRLAL
jgi:hypothetical protein